MHDPLPIYEKRELGSIQSKDGRSFTAYVGLDRDLVEQLKAHSLDMGDAELQNNTSDYKRFGEGSYDEWYAKDRTPYALVSGDGTLVALAWFGPKPLGRKSLRYLSEDELAKEGQQEKSEWHTIVYRSYAPFRGIGLMTPFMHFAISEYKKRFPEATLWAGISTNNPASLGLAKKLGFKEHPEYIDAAANWCALVQE
jgi:RimJ/RimL family protein N-acetyltransferase